MFSIVGLSVSPLDSGIPGVSQLHMILLNGMIISISMIPYLFLYLALRNIASTSARSPMLEFTARPFRKMAAWFHAHQHPALLHH